LSCLNESGVAVPEKVSVIGFDDIDMAKYSNPPLTTVHVYKEEIGILAVRILMDKINGKYEAPVKVVTPCTLIRRSTTLSR
jgi:DNA-binding LacI/PurR family transcriptional regulator